MSIAGFLIGAATGRSAARFEAATHDPVKVQEDLLSEIIQKNAATEYGRKYGFSTIKTHADYVRQVPVVTFDDVGDDMARVAQGAKGVFTAENPVMFAQTSGSTGEPKLIPVTPSDQGRRHQDVMRTWLYHSRKDHPDIFDKKIVSLVSPAIEGYTSADIPFGSTSGHIYRNMPGIIRRAYSVPYEVFEIEDYSARYYAIMRVALQHDVRLLCTANPSSVLKLAEKANEFSEDIIRDIRDGKLSDRYEIEPEIRKVLSKSLKPDPRRAATLEQFRSRRDGRLVPGDYWDRLSLIGCWKGGTVGHYIEKFNQWFDPDGARPVPVRDWGYLASELRGSVPVSDTGSRGVLSVAANYYEFAPVEAVEAAPDSPADWPFLTVREIEDGQEYYIFPTTPSGLYRYDINDIVLVEGTYNKTPQISFLRKGRGMTNLTGEKVSVNQIIQSFQGATATTGLLVDHFKAEADLERSRYLFRAEFSGQAPTGEPARAFLAALDRSLQDLNIEYNQKRQSERLGAPVLHIMREGWYERDRRRQVAEGKRMFQAKTEVLTASKLATREIRPELLDVVEL